MSCIASKASHRISMERAASIGPSLQARIFEHQPIPAEIIAMRDRGALFVINDSGGADSQAMKNLLRSLVPYRQLVIVHAEMRGVDWPGLLDHIKAYSSGIPVLVAQAKRTLFEMAIARGMWPSPKNRQCTSDLKRDPIAKVIRAYLADHPEFNGLVVNCMGLRAEESVSRARREPWGASARNSKAGRTWIDWCPIHDWSKAEVFENIAEHQQKPFWIYAEGMTRCSCVVCIMSSLADIKTAARLAPQIVREYVKMEKRLNFTLAMNGRSLAEITGLAA